MTIQVQVGPPVITINQGRIFMITKSDGTIDPVGELGAFAEDTRFVSTYDFTVNYRPWALLTSQSPTYYAAQYTFQNSPLRTEDGPVLGGDIGLTLTRSISDAIHEDFDIRNYSDKPVRFFFGIRLESDFADIFDVKGHRLLRRNVIRTQWDDEQKELTNSYQREDFYRRLRYRVAQTDADPQYSNGQIVFEVRIAAGDTWHACGVVSLDCGAEALAHPVGPCRLICNEDTEMERSRGRWQQGIAQVQSSNTDVERSFAQAVDDMGALRLNDHDMPDDLWVPAAGTPWFVTLFGRDSLIVSLQNMLVQPKFALGALEKLASYQATERDDWRDAQPGKILHEIRYGELAHFHEIPHTPYYGTADATILYPIVLHEAWRWIGDNGLLVKHRAAAERCLEWIDRFGDLDGDGFQEYKTFSSQGYENMAWKDGHDSVMYPDGSLVPQPKALCEL